MESDIRIAAAVMQCTVGGIEKNLRRIGAMVSDAAGQGAQLICFPEMSATGYSHRDLIDQHAERVPGRISEHLRDLAATHRMTILAGMAETTENGLIYASHLVAGLDGSLAVYRKIHLAPPEQRLFTAGQTVPVFTAAGATFGIQLCYDAHFPELATHMAEAGADILFIPHASPRGDAPTKHRSWMRHLPARAYDNGVFVVACNQVGDNGQGLTFPGNAVIIKPSGEILARELKGTEGLLVADLKRADLAHVRDHRMRYFLPNRRKDLFIG
ncbi:MAG: nitrilase-related carbon-nitrogen hydrolase [Pseudomonadota bacterium]